MKELVDTVRDFGTDFFGLLQRILSASAITSSDPK